MWKFNTLKCSTNTIVARSCQRFSRSNGALTSLSWSWSSSSTMTTSTGTGSRRTISTVTNRLRIGVVGFDGNNNNNNNNRTNPRVAQFHVLAASRAEHSHQKQPFRPQKQKQPQQIIRWFDNEAEYHIVADETLEGLQDSIEQALEGLENTPEEMDISLASGVLTIQLPPHGTWVLNKQTPNQVSSWDFLYVGMRNVFFIFIFYCLTKFR